MNYVPVGVSTTMSSRFTTTIKVPGMTLEEKLYLFTRGLNTNIQISVAMQNPNAVEQAKILASSTDGILSHQRRSLPSGPFAIRGAPFVARPEPM
jgi:hypothetical protein